MSRTKRIRKTLIGASCLGRPMRVSVVVLCLISIAICTDFMLHAENFVLHAETSCCIEVTQRLLYLTPARSGRWHCRLHPSFSSC